MKIQKPPKKLYRTKNKNPSFTKDFTEDFTLIEEILHSVSHGLGALLSIAGLVILIVSAATHGNSWHLVSFSIFGSTLVILYLSSALYHGLPPSNAKSIFKIIDHSAIYLLIAGSYTPFVLVSLRGPWGWSLFGIIWGTAVVGIVMKFISFHRFKRVSYVLYILMGWLCVISYHEMLENIPGLSLKLLVVGGLSYTVGFVFYSWQKLAYNHLVWHFFVLGGSISHYFSVLYIL